MEGRPFASFDQHDIGDGDTADAYLARDSGNRATRFRALIPERHDQPAFALQQVSTRPARTTPIGCKLR